MTEYRERALAATILAALEDMPVVAVTGMRQTGKSTFLQSQGGLKGRRYVTFDDFAQLAAVKEAPECFIDTDEPLTIDEAQKFPEILDAIKKRVDQKRRQGQFLLSGSANFAVLKGISESLAGRAVYFTMHPFTRREIQGWITGKPFVQLFMETGAPPRAETMLPIGEEEVLLGGMPTVCLGDVKDRKLWFKGYEQTYLERDIRQLSQISNIIQFKNLMELAALRTGQLLSPSELGRDAKLNAVTTARYLSLLEASFVVYRLPPYLKNRASRVIKSPKFYLADSGLACYLAGVQTLGSDPLRGAMFETYVAQNLTGIIDACWLEASLHFWNVQGRHEVDFIIEAGRRCLALEIKMSTRWEGRDLAGLRAFLGSTPDCTAAILAYNGSDTVQLGEKLWAVPLSAVLS